jgi:two-component system, chemotaxis family, CheB/CheR fusion protein
MDDRVTLDPGVRFFPVVGIGASAGGLAAFEALFSSIPADAQTGPSYVVVQHLAPDHKSILPELIGRYTPLPVVEAEDGMKVEPDHIYVIPPNQDMALRKGMLRLSAPSEPRGQRLPIDSFFQSLALDQGENAICIVLSGMGSDGTLGVRAIKAEGGITIAQDPATAEYSAMPQSAIRTGLVDLVLPPQEMAQALLDYSQSLWVSRRSLGETAGQTFEDQPQPDRSLHKMLATVRSQTGHDFSGYKPSTITRRVQRRMALCKIEDPAEYGRFLAEAPEEATALFRDFLIGVTRFFREPEMFQALEAAVLPRLFEEKPQGAAIRVWVPGCSTGEEAYSLAILLREHLEAGRHSRPVQVFATDIDREAIRMARAGLFPAGIAADIPADRLARHFVLNGSDGSYRVTKVIRDMLIFSEQDVTRDPPFSHLDLISCRNLMIYLGAELQKKLIPLFHYAINPGGFLALGSAESIGEFTNLFSAVDAKAKLYRRGSETFRLQPAVTRRYRPALIEVDSGAGVSRERRFREGKFSLKELMERLLLQRYAPAAALVNAAGDICYVHGRTGLFLEPSQGEASLNILKMAREGLLPALMVLLRTAAAQSETSRQEGLRVRTNGSFTTIDLEVRAVARVGDAQELFLVLFEEQAAPVQISAGPQAPETFDKAAQSDDADGQLLSVLRQQLQAKDEYLQSTILAMEASNEELRSSHEEMQSINEELQSTNEELETSKEELQSINEELTTVNAELQQRVADLSRVNNDMNNLLAGTGIGTIFVDHQFRIQRFTPAVTLVINLIPSDIGRPVGHIVSNLSGYTSMVEDIDEVLRTLTPKEVEVQTLSGAWFLMRIRPYRTLENVIEGAVVLFFDISDMKRIRAQQQRSESRTRLITASLTQLVLTFTEDGVCDSASPRWLSYTGVAELQPLRAGWTASLHSADRDVVVAKWQQSVSSGNGMDTEFRIRGSEGEFQWFRGHFARLTDVEAGASSGWICSCINIEAERQAESRLRESERQRRVLLDVNPNGVLIWDQAGRVRELNPAMRRILGINPGDGSDAGRNQDLRQLLGRAVDESGAAFDVEKCLTLALPADTEYRVGFLSDQKGTKGWWNVRVATIPDWEGKPAPAEMLRWAVWEPANPDSGEAG